MTTDIRAGTRLRASTLNAIAPVVAYLTNDVSRTSTIVTADTGLSVPIAAGVTYAITGYIPYTAATAGDLRVALVAGGSATGHWGLHALSPFATSELGDLNALRAATFLTGITLFAGGVTGLDLFATVHGTITAGTASTLALWHAQVTSSATASVVKSGAWLRLVRIDT